MNIGDRVKVIDQDITGTIVESWSNKIVIEDEDSEFEDNRLEYKVSEVSPIITEIERESRENRERKW